MTDEAVRADEELSRYKDAKKDIRHLTERIQSFRSRINATSRPPRDIDIQHQSDPKAIEELLASLADMCRDCDRARADAEKLAYVLQLSIRDRCRGISARILTSYYLDDKRLERIALDEDYCYPQIKRLRYRALEEYGRVMLPKDDTR